MKIAVFGMGYVGVVSSACLAADGYKIVGVEISPEKVALLNEGRSPIVEPGVAERIADACTAGRFRATSEPEEALQDAEVALVCVGTPTGPGGGADISAVEAVVASVARLNRDAARPAAVVVRSTITVGAIEERLVPIYRAEAGLPTEAETPLVFHPEFLREGSAVADYYDPPRIVVGEFQPGSDAGDAVMRLYGGFTAPVFRVGYREAELLKYCDNVFHALKITFANEVGLLARACAVDSRALMEMFCADRKLNLSEKYLRPGFAFGGSCLPKDLRGFQAMARQAVLNLPLIASIAESNRSLIERAADAVVARGVRRIGLWGLSFKPGTDDLRESPLVLLAEHLLGKGIELTIVDGSVDEARLIGGNQAYVTRHLPHLGRLIACDPASLSECELVVVGHPVRPELMASWLEAGISVFDLVGTRPRPIHDGYESLT